MRAMTLAFATLVLVACAGPTTGPSSKPQPTGSGGSGGGSSGGSTGTGGNGSGGDGSGGDMSTSPAPTSDGGVTTATVGCAGYVQCLAAAMSAADATACDNKATANAKSILDAVDTCVGSYCLGTSGAAARCKQSTTDGSMQNLDGTPAFDANTGAPTGDCGACLDNGEAGLFGSACMPTTDAACNTSACAQQTAACEADK
ncbi:MAG TPA: hypothetical protein VHB97_12250 [Polyangia bacterium]|nr:hypothetical protein [Polyangia bacterium]